MAVGRLKKETNPLPGYEPGFLPQHERADGEFQTTGENHPLPTGNYVQTNSGVWVPQKGSDDGAAHVQLTGSSVKQEYVTIADAVAITDTAMHSFNLISHGGLSEEEIRQFKNFKISIVNSHDQRARIDLFTAIKPLGVTTASSLTRIYQEANAVPANPGRFILQSSDIGEEGSVDTIKTVPALRNIHSNLIISISFNTAPTSGSMTIGVEMHG